MSEEKYKIYNAYKKIVSQNCDCGGEPHTLGCKAVLMELIEPWPPKNITGKKRQKMKEFGEY